MNNLDVELVKKRNAELECLGIPPKLYYVACNLLDKHVKSVLKDGILYKFINEERLKTSSPDKRFNDEKCLELLEHVLSINKDDAMNILLEYKREKKINLAMYKNMKKYWKYIFLSKTLDRI